MYMFPILAVVPSFSCMDYLSAVRISARSKSVLRFVARMKCAQWCTRQSRWRWGSFSRLGKLQRERETKMYINQSTCTYIPTHRNFMDSTEILQDQELNPDGRICVGWVGVVEINDREKMWHTSLTVIRGQYRQSSGVAENYHSLLWLPPVRRTDPVCLISVGT